MVFSWQCSLNRNGSPGAIARKARPPLGCQKFTSSRSGRARRKRYQSRSVTPTYARILASGERKLLDVSASRYSSDGGLSEGGWYHHSEISGHLGDHFGLSGETGGGGWRSTRSRS